MAFIVAVRTAAILLLAASAATEFANDEQTVPAGNWRYIDVPLHERAARISASFEGLRGSDSVRLALVAREDLDPTGDEPPQGFAATPPGSAGAIADSIRRRGDYAVVLDNRDGKQEATVRLHIWLDWDGPDVQKLIPRKQFTVVAVSCVAFLGIVAFSARRLRRAMKP
ncbi:MAG: hypothetical protein WDO73_21630 [Ignavibacteriota bacterium]